MLCRQIPPPICLVIKDHKEMMDLENSFYKTLGYLPNVKLVHKNVNPYELIKFSKGVICLTGRIGFESYILNKKFFYLVMSFTKIGHMLLKLTPKTI